MRSASPERLEEKSQSPPTRPGRQAARRFGGKPITAHYGRSYRNYGFGMPVVGRVQNAAQQIIVNRRVGRRMGRIGPQAAYVLKYAKKPVHKRKKPAKEGYFKGKRKVLKVTKKKKTVVFTGEFEESRVRSAIEQFSLTKCSGKKYSLEGLVQAIKRKLEQRGKASTS